MLGHKIAETDGGDDRIQVPEGVAVAVKSGSRSQMIKPLTKNWIRNANQNLLAPVSRRTRFIT